MGTKPISERLQTYRGTSFSNFIDHCKFSVSIFEENAKSTCIQPPPQSLCVYHENLRIELISFCILSSPGSFLLLSRSEQEAEHHFMMTHKMVDKSIFLVLTRLN